MSQCISLDGDWQLAVFPEAGSPVRGPDDLADHMSQVVTARVPGNVELDLQRAGILPEPFYAGNIRRLREYEFYEWWYTKTFEAPPQTLEVSETSRVSRRHELVFAGLDTLATVWLNGVEVGRSANALIEHRFDVTDALRPGINRIVVRLGSAVNHARQFSYDAASMSWEHREEGLFIRKAPHVWGWDIMPRAVSAGIWRSVWIEERPATAIEQIYYWTAGINAEGATIGVRFQIRTDAATTDGYWLRFRGVLDVTGTSESAGHIDAGFAYDWPLEFIAGGCRIPVPDARLWWPKGYGEPALYTVTAQLVQDGQIVAERTDRIGIRHVVVDRTETAGAAWAPEPADGGVRRMDAPADPASHFVFRVNDVPIMVKGSNWVPLDAFHSRDAERVDRAVALFADLGCNMIRCWGGNVYEDHRFFDLCDEAGILVWQDFAFACCRYPQTDAFLAEVRREAESVVARLRNHPSLAIWCGDNEIDMAYVSDGLSPEHNRLTREIIPQVVHRLDPHRAFVPSSPYVPPSVGPVAGAWQKTPEQHLWGPRGYFKSPFYTLHSAHFIGEQGYHGCPNVSSIRRFISPDKLWPWDNNAEWQEHAVYHWQHPTRDRDRIKLMANQVRELFGAVPDDLETFALASQITQAEAKKFFIEMTRLRKWRTSGILWWNVIDGWPQFSDAIVDYTFGVKLAYHYIRRVQQPVSVIVGEPGPGKRLPLIVGNDSRTDADVRYRVWDADSGETVADGAFRARANENWQVGTLRTFASDQRLYLIEWEITESAASDAGVRRFGSHYLAGTPPFDLERYQRVWLPAIAALPQAFDVESVAR
jgi:beta-mannosidase